jgi:tellurite resistance protein TehA-like permease
MADRIPPAGERHYAGALRGLLVQMAPPYGFSLATFASAGITAHGQDGLPNPWQIVLFLAGAFTGYALLAVIVRSLFERVAPAPIPLNAWQGIHVLPLGVVFALALASAELVGYPVAWFTSGMALTFGYLGTFAWVLRIVEARRVAKSGGT